MSIPGTISQFLVIYTHFALKVIDEKVLKSYKDQCLQEIEAGGNVKEKLLCQTKRPEPSGPLYEP